MTRMPRRLGSLVLALTLLGPVALVALSGPTTAAVPSEQQWAADVNQAMAGSRVLLGRRVEAGGRRLAVNLDIDNTSLASHYSYGDPVPVVLRFAKYAEGHGVTLLFNTGRVRGNGAQVLAARQLRAAGYPVTEVCGRADADESLVHGKQRCRRHFVGEGYTIVANVGNRRTDFLGGNYERAFRLPSYGDQLA
jgi:hypothetical protein